MAILKEIEGPEPGRQFRLDKPRMVLGRHPDCDIIVEVDAVSRYHAQILLAQGAFFLEDLNSRNGTFVNDRLIRDRHPLQENDRIRVCDVSFAFLPEPTERIGRRSPIGTGTAGSVVLVDDDPSSRSSTIMSKLDVTVGPQGGTGISGQRAELTLAALLEISRSLGRAISMDEVLPQVLDGLFKIFRQADRGLIILGDESGDVAPRWTKTRDGRDEETISISRTIVRQAMQSREAFLSADTSSDERFNTSQSIANFRIRSVMCAPLITSDGEVLGVLQLDTQDQGQRFQLADLEILASVASQAATGIHNAQLHDRAMQQEALQQELKIAEEVQRSFLPQSVPRPLGYEFFDFYRPANQIGGDYFDYLQFPDGRVAVIIADVVGHGVAAALLMARLSSESRFYLATEGEPAHVLTRLNARLCGEQLDGRFVTLVIVILDPHQHALTVVNAGHMAPILCRREHPLLEIGHEEAGLPLGIVEDFGYAAARCSLEPGDSVVLFTDGISEAMNVQGELYGMGRLRTQVARSATNAEALGESLIDNVQQFMGEHPQTDDMCLVCFRRTPTEILPMVPNA